jgi:hypothetical protein
VIWILSILVAAYATLMYFIAPVSDLYRDEVGPITEADLFRSISLAVGPHDHPDACKTFAELRRLGWTVELEGHRRSGRLTVTLTNTKWGS